MAKRELGFPYRVDGWISAYILDENAPMAAKDLLELLKKWEETWSPTPRSNRISVETVIERG